jgi:hypothetical protein
MRDGSGGEYSVLFSAAGAYVRGFGHESPMSRYAQDGDTERSTFPPANRRFAEGYYEVPVDLEAVRHVYASRPLTADVVSSLNAEATLSDLAGEIGETGCPGPGRDSA